MSVTATSDDCGTVTPYFTVDDPDRLIAFLETVFEANLIKMARYEDGTVQHARVKIGDTVLMMNQSTPDYAPNISQMHVLVEDVDAVFAAALEAGATPTMQPNIRPHGDRMAGITDPCGNTWWIAATVD